VRGCRYCAATTSTYQQYTSPIYFNKEIAMKRRTINASVLTTFLGYTLVPISARAASGDRRLFVARAIEHPDNSVTLPLYQGTSNGETVWYMILDSSDGNDAQALGVNRSSKLANARGSTAVMKVKVNNGVIDFPASVDFSLTRSVVPAPTGFPPLAASPGAKGRTVNGIAYSPLIEMPDGTIRNAPQIANASGQADKVLALNKATGTVRYRETDGFSGGKAVKYVSTDSSLPDVAALENVTLAEALGVLPTLGDDSTDSARASLAAFINGQTGAGNPQRQGLNSALLDGLDPLNVLRWAPNQGRYSPMWDVHLAQWSAAAVANGKNLRQMDWGQVRNLADHGDITGPGGAPFAAVGAVVNCPIISQLG
jgi:hypothetical protein